MKKSFFCCSYLTEIDNSVKCIKFVVVIIYLLLDLYIFILYINKKITTPSYFPNYLRNWLIEKEERSQLAVEGLRVFVDLHVRNILVYILSLLIIILLLQFTKKYIIIFFKNL